MLYVSTNGNQTVSLRQAVEQCYAGDGHLYLPATLPRLPKAYFNNIGQMTLQEIAFVVLRTLLDDEIDAAVLKDIVDRTFDIRMPVLKLDTDRYVMEMFHGPTMAFKDFGARFMGEIIRHFHRPGDHVRVYVATTGNTGGAVANAVGAVDGVDVNILFPRGTLTRAQRAQFSTVAPNIRPVEVSGTIGQCKAMVRQAIQDPDLGDGTLQICANTQNILRILPQVVFFFHAYARLSETLGPAADGFSVAIPCGNLSNLTAAVIALRMGLPMGRIVAGCNANDDFKRVLDGSLSPDAVNRTARPTLAAAMDSGYPANLPRLLSLYGGDLGAMRADIVAVAADDDAIADTINNCIFDHCYTADPHTAVAMYAARQAAPAAKPAVILATAHPAKSLDTMTAITGRAVELPLQFTRFMSKPAPADKLAPSFHALKKYISAHGHRHG